MAPRSSQGDSPSSCSEFWLDPLKPMDQKVASEKSGIDRREFERVPARVEVRFQERDDAAKAFRAFSLNFSIGGLCLKTDRPYQIGAALGMWIQIAGGRHPNPGRGAGGRGGRGGRR